MNPFGDLRSPQAVDVTIVSPLSIENLNSGARNKGGAVARAEEKKKTLNSPACSKLGWDVRPFAVDSYGCFGEKASRLVGLLAKNISIEENTQTHSVNLFPSSMTVFRLHLSENRVKPSWDVANNSPDGRTAITQSCPNPRRCSCHQPLIAIPHHRNRFL
jgi:hypothetical protein